MNKINKSKLLIAMFGATLSTSALALEYETTQLATTAPGAFSRLADINNNSKVLWIEMTGNWGDPQKIMMGDSTETHLVSTTLNDNSFEQAAAKLNDSGNVAWFDRDLSSFAPNEVKLWDGVEIRTISMNNDEKLHLTQLTNSGQVAWLEGNYLSSNVMLSDGNSVTNISDTFDQFPLYPALNETGQIIWTTRQALTYPATERVMLWNGQTVQEIAAYDDGSWFGDSPRINDHGEALWSTNRPDGANLFYWDGSQVQTIASTTEAWGGIGCLDINNEGHAVWTLFGPSGFTIQYWDGTQVTNVGKGECATLNDAGHIAWTDTNPDTGLQELYVKDGDGIQQLAQQSYFMDVLLNETGDIAWNGNGGVYLTAVKAPLTADELLQLLIDSVTQLNINAGIANSLDAKLSAAQAALQDVKQNNDLSALNVMNAFISSVEAQSGNQIATTDASQLIADAQAIIDLLSAN